MMQDKKLYELFRQISEGLHTMINQIDDYMQQLESGTDFTPEKELPLSTMPAQFKGKRPVAVIYHDGTEVPVSTWKQAARQLLRDCAEIEMMRDRLQDLQGKVFGRSRLLLSDSPEGLHAPLEYHPNMFFESYFDTESLLRVLTTRVFDPIGYDYQGIRLRIVDPTIQAVIDKQTEGPEADEAEEEQFQEDEGFIPMM